MRRRPIPILRRTSSSCGRADRDSTDNSRRTPMAKTMPRLRASKSSRRSAVSRTAVSGRVKAKGGKSRAHAASPKAKVKAKVPAKQTFNVSHFREDDFRNDGLRSYASYRDLGMSKATNGRL